MRPLLCLLLLACPASGWPATQPSETASDAPLATERTTTSTTSTAVSSPPSTTAAPADFRSDCADPHNSQVKCTVHEAVCDDAVGVALVAPGAEPPEAHDLRLDSYTKMTGKEARHQLHVEISWQMPPSNDSYRLRAFLLEIVPDGVDDEKEEMCFLFNVSDYNWTANSSSPRFHFSTDSLFEFAGEYVIRVKSLPRSRDHQPLATKRVTMDRNPGSNAVGYNTTDSCKTQANLQASKWTAGFRKIFLNALTRTIQIQFVAAPPSICFEAYEVRLLDGSGLELLHSHIVDAANLRELHENGQDVFLGEHNFTDLNVEVDYIPSVMPVERAADGRCLCPLASDPSDRHVVCSCIAADWKKVRLSRVSAPSVSLTTLPPPKPVQEPRSRDNWPLLAAAVALGALLVLVCIACILYVLAKKYRSRGKLIRTRFIPDGPSQQLLIDPRHASASCANQWSVLIVYAHDHALHEAVVQALAEFLRDSFAMTVHLDQWEHDEIEAHLHDYINNSVLRADKILIVNSVGAYCRLQARSRREPLERLRPDPLDHLFEAQIDMALQHARVISCRFSYTPSSATLFSLSPLLQYSVPENLPLLLSALTENSARNDPRLLVGGSGGYDPALDRLRATIIRMQNFIDEDPEWFEHSHRRVPLRELAAPRYEAATQVAPLLPALSTAVAGEAEAGEEPLDSGIAEASRSLDAGLSSRPPEGIVPPLPGVLDVKEQPEEQRLLEEHHEEAIREPPPLVLYAKDDDAAAGPSGDSAYHSGTLPTQSADHSEAEKGESIPMVELTQLPNGRRRATGESDSMDSGQDESSEEAGSRRHSNEYSQPPRIEDAYRARVKGEALETGDSGNISDFHSGLVENY